MAEVRQAGRAMLSRMVPRWELGPNKKLAPIGAEGYELIVSGWSATLPLRARMANDG